MIPVPVFVSDSQNVYPGDFGESGDFYQTSPPENSFPLVRVAPLRIDLFSLSLRGASPFSSSLVLEADESLFLTVI